MSKNLGTLWYVNHVAKRFKDKQLPDTGTVRIYHEFKRARNPKDKFVYKKELYKSCILIPVLSKSVEKLGSCGCLNICKWTVMEAAIL